MSMLNARIRFLLKTSNRIVKDTSRELIGHGGSHNRRLFASKLSLLIETYIRDFLFARNETVFVFNRGNIYLLLNFLF